MATTRVVGILAAVVLLGVACTGAGDLAVTEATDTGAPAAAAATTASEPTAPQSTAPAVDTQTSRGDQGPLDFTARRLSGGTFDGAAHRGEAVVLWIWAPWCPQCNREAPHVADAVERFGDRVTFVGVPGHDTDEAHRAFVDEHDLGGITHVVDDDGSLWARFGINYQPAWVFVDEDGESEVVAGGLYDELDARVQDLVGG